MADPHGVLITEDGFIIYMQLVEDFNGPKLKLIRPNIERVSAILIYFLLCQLRQTVRPQIFLKCFWCKKSYPAGIYLFIVNNRDIRTNRFKVNNNDTRMTFLTGKFDFVDVNFF